MTSFLSSADTEQLDRGCIGLAAAECAVKTGRTDYYGEEEKIYLKLPEAEDERFGHVRAYRTLANAQSHTCSTGGRKVIFVKVGRWNPRYQNGPQDIPGGEPGQIPVDSVIGTGYMDIPSGRYLEIFNCVTLVAGKWFEMNTSRKDAEYRGIAQGGDVHTKPPKATDGQKIMFVVRCLPPGN